MKRIILALVVALVLFTSCKQTDESKIKQALKEYVNNNFNDPNDFKEIVSIELSSSTNTDSMRNLFVGAAETFMLLEVKFEELQLDTEAKTKNKKQDASLNTLLRVLETFNSVNELRLSQSFKEAKNSVSEINSISDNNGFEEYDTDVYLVKCRVKVGERLRIQNFYAIFDRTKSENNIRIQDHNLQIDEYPEFYFVLFQKTESIFDVTKEYLRVLPPFKQSLDKMYIECGIN